MPATMETETHDFYNYTGGRWLWDEQQQLQDRSTTLNVAELADAALERFETKCVSITKLAEGGYNKVFRLVTDSEETVIARIPNPNVGNPCYTTASEVATMEFARDVLGIPVPKVIMSFKAPDPRAASGFIMMEEAKGTSLKDAWGHMTPESKLTLMRELISIERKLLSISFSHYGSLYQAGDDPPGAVSAQIISEAPVHLKTHVETSYRIGTSVNSSFWHKERATMDIPRGPWRSPEEYASDIAHREIAWLEQYGIHEVSDDCSKAQNDPAAHIDLLRKYLQVVPRLVNVDKKLAGAALWHPDLRPSNIFVDEAGHITSVIDWQGAWTGPLFLQALPSPILTYNGPMLLKQPENFANLDPAEQSRLQQQISRSLLHQLYLFHTEKENPILAKIIHLKHGRTRRLPIALAGNTWDEDIIPFREALINVEQYWWNLRALDDAIGGGEFAPCPIHFKWDELRAHHADAEAWNESQDFFDSIRDLVKKDGWTSHERYDEAVALFRELKVIGLRGLDGEDKERWETIMKWVDKHELNAQTEEGDA